MKNLTRLSTVLILFLSGHCFAQISGISTDKLASINASTLTEGQMELEPTFSYFRSLGYFDRSRDFKDYTGIIIQSALTFRASYGLNDHWEIGANVSTQFNTIGLGTKYYLIGNDKFGLGLMAGLNSDITNGPRLLSSLSRQYIFGITSHYHFSELLSLNASIQYQDSRDYVGSDVFFNSEIGYYLSKELMLVAGIGIAKYSDTDLGEASLFTIYPGFNFHRKMFDISLQSQFDLAGKNINAYNGLSLSITQLLN